MTERLNEFFSVMQAELTEKLTSLEGRKSFAVRRQLERARKRAAFYKSELKAEAVQRFVETNEHVGAFMPSLDPQDIANARHFITVMLERYTASQVEEAVQTPLALELIWDNWRFGPGASNGIRGTHCADKIRQPMTCTAQSAPLVRKLRSFSPYFALFDSECESGGITVVRGSRLATVPKNEDTERTIAIEPSGSMCLQLAGGHYLEGVLRYIGLDIRKQQPKNKAAAKRGSETGRLATIDMKSASDLISLVLVRLLLPKEWIWFLETVRSREIELPDGTWVKLNMISTMGNGFTFPLMTLIITALIYAYRCRNGGPVLYIDWSDTCVYGDDVIVPVEEYDGVCEILTAAGFLINHEKSFSEGPFRESCGGDYYEGVDVTPFYVKSLASQAEVFVAINQVLEWCEKTGVFLYQTLILLKSYLDTVYLVPEWLNPDQGIQSNQVKRRYKYLQARPMRKTLPNTELFAMPLACGGYITSSGTHAFYTPRARRPKVCVRQARLPRGYLDGWDPDKRSRQVSDGIAAVVAILF